MRIEIQNGIKGKLLSAFYFMIPSRLPIILFLPSFNIKLLMENYVEVRMKTLGSKRSFVRFLILF